MKNSFFIAVLLIRGMLAVRRNPSNLVEDESSELDIETKQPPKLAERWSGVYVGQQGYMNATVVYNFDKQGQQFRIESKCSQGGKPLQDLDFAIRHRQPYALNLTVITTSIPFGSGGMCFPIEWTWEQATESFAFAWLENAQFKSSQQIGGVSCDVWESSASSNALGKWSACIDSEGVPRGFSSQLSPAAIGSSLVEYFDMTEMVLQNITTDSVDEAAFAATTACADWPPANCESKEVVTTNIYRNTGFMTETPADYNANDLMGFLFGVCMGVPWSSAGTALYKISMSSNFGQFAMCDYISSTGKMLCKGQPQGCKSVGRTYFGKTCVSPTDCGQCHQDSLMAPMGLWYSFPKSGLCSASGSIGDNGCTWKVDEAQVLNTSCIVEASGIIDRCKQIMIPIWADVIMNETKEKVEAAIAPGGACPAAPLKPSGF